MPMHHEARSKFRKEIRALGRQQDAAPCVVFDLRERDGREQQRHRRAARLHSGDGDAGASQALCQYVAGQNGRSKCKAVKRGTGHHGDTAVGRGCQKGFEVIERRCFGQSRQVRAEYQPMHGQALKSVRADLNSGKIPPRRETMMSVREEESLAIERGLRCGDIAKICNWPELMERAEGVNGFLWHGALQAWRQREIRPQPETPGVCASILNGSPAGRHTFGKCLFMRVNFGFGAVQQTHHAVANRFVLFAWKAKVLAIEEERWLSVLHQVRKRERLLLTGNIDFWVWRAEGSKRQDDRHLANTIRVTGAAQ